jgi:hypothetical protein
LQSLSDYVSSCGVDLFEITFMKTLLALLTITCMLASCSRTGSTIANDDSAINDRMAQTASAEKFTGGYPISEKSLPAAVRTAFYDRYTGANNTQWQLLPDGTYRADFFIGKIKWLAIYAADGTLVHEEHM